jgi:4-hydroxybenzoate polyprenyltransferase
MEPNSVIQSMIQIHKVLDLLCTFIYQFTVANDINGVIEDKINKPEIAIPSGLVSMRKAWIHYVLSVILYLIYGYSENFLLESFIWSMTSFIAHFSLIVKNGFLKKVLMFPGIYVLFNFFLVLCSRIE